VLVTPVSATDPAALADRIVRLGEVSGGRARLCLGDQPATDTLTAAGSTLEQVQALIMEALDLVQGHLEAPVWVATADDAMIQAATARGLPVVGLSWETRPQLTARSQAATAGGNGPRVAPFVRDVFVGEADEPAWDEVAPALEEQYAWYQSAGRFGSSTMAHSRGRGLYGRQARKGVGRAIVGDARSVAEQLKTYEAECGVNHVVCRMSLPGLSPEQVQASMDRFANGVVPALRDVKPE
jgi:alkanesulfonate monooxygenase SsuD/methylene tetrahydromethanopterin reductase-like flavin-dependent oxidoreductase (luciferase family)